ncbi:MAG: hypothetical protein U0269_25280 [Polyangiales bacterium]
MSLYQLDWSDEPEAPPPISWDWNASAPPSLSVIVRAVDGAKGACTQRALTRAASRRALLSRTTRRRAERRATRQRFVSERSVHRCLSARPPPA